MSFFGIGKNQPKTLEELKREISTARARLAAATDATRSALEADYEAALEEYRRLLTAPHNIPKPGEK